MYEIYLDNRILDVPGDRVNCVVNPELKLALNDAGSLQFDISLENPEFDNIFSRNSIVTVMKDGKEIFSGEVRDIEKDSYNIKNVYAVGELSYLYDSIQPPAEYHDLSPRQMLETWINIHNSQVEGRKQFRLGIVTVHDTNDRLYRYTNRENTLDAIREKLVGKLGGYLRVRKVNGVKYLDWLAMLEEYGKYCEQKIEFGTNLLDYTETLSASELATAVIPLGARLEESPIEALEAYTDITSVNSGKDYIYIEEAVNRFGWIKKVVNWDDVTEPANLKKKGEDWLKDNQYETMVLELTAVDLSELNAEYEAFELGDIVHTVAEPYGLDRTFPVRERTIYLHSPEQSTIVLGTTENRTFTKQSSTANKNFSTQLESTRQTTAWLQSAIDNATAMMTGSKGGYKVSEYDEDGRWLRDLYMNAPTKEDATLVMQINMNGIGFSRDGFDGPYKNAWTIDGVLLGEFIKAGSVQAEALSAEYKASVTDEIDTTVTAKFEVAEGLISAEVTRATGAEEELAASLTITSELVETKVSKDDIGSYVQQYYDQVLIGFNNDSRYLQITAGQIAIYDNGVENSKKRSAFDQNGNHFYRDGYYVGKIGTNSWAKDRSHKGLEFDLEYRGKYMAWTYKRNESDTDYTAVLTFSRANSLFSEFGIHTSCDLYGEWHTLTEFAVGSISAGGYAGYTGSIPIITSVRDNGDGSITWEYSNLQVRNGIVVGYWN